MYVCIYIYIMCIYTHTHLSLSLSLSIYIYIHTYTRGGFLKVSDCQKRQRRVLDGWELVGRTLRSRISATKCSGRLKV